MGVAVSEGGCGVARWGDASDERCSKDARSDADDGCEAERRAGRATAAAAIITTIVRAAPLVATRLAARSPLAPPSTNWTPKRCPSPLSLSLSLSLALCLFPLLFTVLLIVCVVGAALCL
jgi:hypothetical protein